MTNGKKFIVDNSGQPISSLLNRNSNKKTNLFTVHFHVICGWFYSKISKIFWWFPQTSYDSSFLLVVLHLHRGRDFCRFNVFCSRLNKVIIKIIVVVTWRTFTSGSSLARRLVVDGRTKSPNSPLRSRIRILIVFRWRSILVGRILTKNRNEL